MNISEKIEVKMNDLEELMKQQLHLKQPESTLTYIESISVYWAHMTDDDKDYVDCATDALKNKREWLI